MNKERLLNVARALRESPSPEKFSMRTEVTNDGRYPSCAFAHYFFRTDLQGEFMPRQFDDGTYSSYAQFVDGRTSTTGQGIVYNSYKTLSHFEIDRKMAEDLFGAYGCDNAKTPEEAAQYIEKFVEEHS